MPLAPERLALGTPRATASGKRWIPCRHGWY
jgi:hypothetical protein